MRFILGATAVALSASAALAAPANPAGPAVLIVLTAAGYQFAHFSSMARCEAARETIVADHNDREERTAPPGYEPVRTLFSAQCVPG